MPFTIHSPERQKGRAGTISGTEEEVSNWNSLLAARNIKCTTTLKSCLIASYKGKRATVLYPAILLIVIYPRETKTYTHKKNKTKQNKPRVFHSNFIHSSTN